MKQAFKHTKSQLLTLLLLLIVSAFLWLYNNQKPTRVVIGINTWTGYDPLILADEMDFFEKNNVQVTVQQFASTGEELKAFKEGRIEAAGLTLDEAFSLIGAGYSGKIVLVIDFSQGGDMIIGQPDIHSISDLKAKRVGYEGTVVGEFLLQRALQFNHIKNSEVQLINIPAENWVESFNNKDVDALVCFNPVSTILMKEEGGNLLFSSKNIPFEIIDVLLFSESFFEKNKTTVKKIVQVWFDAVDYIDRELEDAARLIAKRKGISPEVYKTGLIGLNVPKLKVNQQLLKIHSGDNLHKYSQNIIDFMLEKGLLNSRVSTLDVFDDSIVSSL